MFSIFILGLLVFLALFASFIAPYDPQYVDVSNKLLSPSSQHLLGTDQLGRDVFSRLLYGARYSLFLAVAISVLEVVTGFIVGLVVGWYQGKIEGAFLWLTNVLMAFPSFLLSLATVGILGQGMSNMIATVNPVRRKQPSELIATGIAGIDLNNTLVSGQKIPFFADPDQPFNQVMANVALRAETDKIILGGMGMTNDDYLYFKNVFSNAGALDRIVSFMNTTENPPVERLLIPDMALTAAEYFAVNNNEKVLVLLTDMTSYADALAIVSNRMDQIPSKDSMPGSIYSDLAKIYEKAVQFPSGGSITIIAVTTLSGGDITHAVPDNTGYITEGQLFLRRDSDIGKVIVDPFRSLSRLKQLVTGKKTRKDHPQVMNAAVRLYADAANAKTKMENGFDLTNYDERTLAFAKDYSNQLLAIDVNLDTTEMLDVAWGLFGRYFRPEEVNIKKDLVDQYWPKGE